MPSTTNIAEAEKNASLTTDKLASKAHAGVDRLAEKAGPAEEKARDAAQRATDRADEISEDAMAAANEAVTTARKNIKANPLLAAGTAFAVGFVVSALLRR